MNKDKHSLQISKVSSKENELYDDKEINVEKDFNEEDFCDCEEQINNQKQLIDSLKTRIKELETDYYVKSQDIKKLQQKFKSICPNITSSPFATNKRRMDYDSQVSSTIQDIKNSVSSEKVKGYNDEECYANALCSARIIYDLNSVEYPPHIKPPNPALNSNAEPGKFRYGRNFMMQFMGVCRERPKNLHPLYDLFIEQPEKPARSRSSRRKSRQIQSRMDEEEMTSPTTDIFGETELSHLDSTPSGRKDGLKGVHRAQEPNIEREKVVPLERSEDRRVPADILPKVTEDIIPIEVVIRDVRELLKELTFEKFDLISDQIIKYANRSRDEKDGRILREVIHLIIERLKPQDICAIYAQLCYKMIERVDPGMLDENVKNTEGQFVQGGALVRKYLLNRCQEDFEKGWEISPSEKGESTDATKSRKKAKRRGLGLIYFISELFKLNMVTERIMHECIKKLLVFQNLPGEEEMETLCKLMNKVGERLDRVETNRNEHNNAKLDHTKAKQLMEAYFTRMMEITKLPNLSTRIKSMLMDIIDLRNNAWKPPKKIDVAKHKEEVKTTSSGVPKMEERVPPSGSSGHGQPDKGKMSQESTTSPEDDGWSVVSSRSSSHRNKDKVGDLTKFGSLSRSKISGKVSLAPGGIFGVLSGGAKGWSKGSKKS